MTVVWSRRAARHLRALLDSISSDGPQRAELVAARILEAVELLATQPHMGRPGRVVGTRAVVPAPVSFRIGFVAIAWNLSPFFMAVRDGRRSFDSCRSN
jgi:toxin ParE1/3/4